jgi:NADH:ubiquinone oxidoreductase subunit 5 (subunit L)/multisubunit Na+/H+ antiporter MnhA subunit
MTFYGTYRGGESHAEPGHAQADHGHEADHGHGHGHDAGHGVAGHDAHGHAGHGHAHVPHESPWPMTVSLCCLALLGVLGGHFWLATPTDPLASHTEPWFLKAVSLERLYGGLVAEPHLSEHIEHQAHTLALWVSLGVALGGIAIAYLLYGAKKIDPAKITGALGEVYHAVANKYWIDETVNATVIKMTLWLALAQKWFDENVVDGVVNGVGAVTRALFARSTNVASLPAASIPFASGFASGVDEAAGVGPDEPLSQPNPDDRTVATPTVASTRATPTEEKTIRLVMVIPILPEWPTAKHL